MLCSHIFSLNWISYQTDFFCKSVRLLQTHSIFSIFSHESWNLFVSYNNYTFSSVQLFSRVRVFATPWTAAHQVSLSITNCQSLPKPMSIELVMPSNHLILCRPLLFLSSIFPSIRVLSYESALHIRWPKYWSYSQIIF